MDKIIKTYTVERKGDWVIASTPSFDRDKDRVMPRGIDTTNFQKNPALFYGHNYSDPWAVIGRVAEWKIDDERMMFRPEFREPAGEGDPMHIIRSLWETGLLKASSIGFIPQKGTKNDAGGMDFSEVELLEISIVPLPANQDAIRMAFKALADEPVASAPEDTPPAEEPQPANDMESVLDELRSIVGELRELRELLQPDPNNEGAGDEENEPVGALLDYDSTQASKRVKRGRVLSAGNESKLRTAHDAIGEVLMQLGDGETEQTGKEAGDAMSDEAVAAMLGDLVKAFRP